MMEACRSRFTPAEGGARLAAAAATTNILAVEYASFIPVRLLYEKAYQIRGSLFDGSKRSIYITRATRVDVVAFEMKILTDLETVAAKTYDDVFDWMAELDKKEVLICTSSVLKQILAEEVLSMNNINVMIVESCHLIYKDECLQYIMQVYKCCPQTDQPTILSLTYPLFNSNKKDSQETEGEMGAYENLDDFHMYEKLEWKIEELEKELCCQMDLAEDIDGGKRISSSTTKPRELIIEYGPRPLDDSLSEAYKDLETYMRDCVLAALEFIEDHRHDPTEIYGDELYEELMSIPDPTIEPKQMFKQFLYVLEQLGPYAADKAALCLLLKIEKYKVKIPYERHFLLYCLCTTIFLKIRYYAELLFSQYEDEWERIKTFSSPKVLRLAEILEKFQPPDVRSNTYETKQDIGGSGRDIGASGRDIGGSSQDIGGSSRDIGGSGRDIGGSSQNIGGSSRDIGGSSRDIGGSSRDIGGSSHDIGGSGRDIGGSSRDIGGSGQDIGGISQGTLESSQKETANDILSKKTEKMLNDIEKCDFASLGNKIEDKVFIYESGLKEIEDLPTDSVENKQNNSNATQKPSETSMDIKLEPKNTDFLNPEFKGKEVMVQKGLLGFTRRAGYRLRGRTRLQRNNAARVLQMQQNPDALCGIIFMKEALIAKIMFMVIVDMSRSNSRLKYLCAQYCCTDNPADPGTEPKECQRQGKKQEEVLKKFRMHECNLLLATSALEEGIDLPRCNLVLRWDVPPSYRSYGLCRGRARASRASTALLCSDDTHTTDLLLHNVATYRELDQIISRKCGCGIQDEPPQSEEDHADTYNYFIKPYTPNEDKDVDENKDKDTNLQESKYKDLEESMDTNTEDSDKYLENDCNSKINKNDLNNFKYTKNKDKINDSNEERQDCKNKDIKDETELIHKFDRNSIGSEFCNKKVDDVSYNDDSCNDFDKNICKNEVISNDIDENNFINKNDLEISKNDANKEINSNQNQSKIIENNIEIETNDKNCNITNEITIKTANININIINNNKLEEKQTAKTLPNNETGEPEITYEIETTKNKTGEIETMKSDSENYSNQQNYANVVKIKDETLRNINQSDKNTQSIKEQSSNTKKNLEINVKLDINSQDLGDKDDNVANIDDVLPKECCNKCLNVKISGVCLCDNATTYYMLLDKCNNSVNKCNSKKCVSESAASVDLSSAIALINRYCGKLPSDTFTRLAPQWWMEEVHLPVQGSEETRPAYICTLRLPLNCPVKYNIVGHPMPTRVLARRMVALQACRILHKSGELDNQLMPIGKENFKAVELFTNITGCGGNDNAEPSDSARPGTTKRRQYYYKRTAWAFTDCQPVIDSSDLDIDSPASEQPNVQDTASKETEAKPTENTGKKRNMLYAIESKLWCALPERYNTRGRRLHAPQNAKQAIGILMAREEPDNLQIPAFPVYTRSGEVRVRLQLQRGADVRLSARRASRVRRFMRFVFAEVLRVRRRGMRLHSDAHYYNNYYIVPTIKTTENGISKIDIDWAFLELIYQHTEDKKLDIERPILWQEEEKLDKDKKKRKKRMLNPLLKDDETFVFDAEKYREAVVTPWYRNQDQPQFFLVAEICWNLTPDSSFPSATHQSFRDYYNTKYGVTLTQREQPLLDVDHTSARLNLLTPRYVNRKGVALPVSSERTRRAKRDRLDQKQILIPELCRVHPFAAPLWFSTVALPCVLYRINALLIADEIRRAVAIDVGLGVPKINEQTMPGFQWPALDFGWSLAEVLSADSEKNEKKKEEEQKREQKELKEKEELEKQKDQQEEKTGEVSETEEVKEKTINDILQEKENAAGFEIGTWSNEMASSIPEESEYDEMMEPLPPNLTFCTSASGGNNWCDPVPKPKFSQFNPAKNFSMADSDDSFMSSDLDSDDSDLDYEGSDEDTDVSGFSSSKNTNASMGVRIEYKTAHEAEAFDIERVKKVNPAPLPDEEDDLKDRMEHDKLIRQGSAPQEFIEKFRASVSKHEEDIKNQGHLIPHTKEITEILPDKENYGKSTKNYQNYHDAISELFPFGAQELIVKNGQIDVESIEKNKRVILGEIKKMLPGEKIKKLNCFSMKDINIDAPEYVNEKIANVGFDRKEGYEEMCKGTKEFQPYYMDNKSSKEFDFDYQPKLEGHPGPSPSVILQALTMSNANDGINLERLETIGDSFLKFAITAYLYCAHPTVHEGKLSHMRSKQVSNLNLYRLGRNKRLGARMIASKFEPHDNWLPPCHKPPPTLHPRPNGEDKDIPQNVETPPDSAGCFIPYNLITQHSIPDKSIADCVEALIGAYLLECGPRGALLFMSWLGIRVLPCHHVPLDSGHPYVAAAERAQGPQRPVQKPSPPSTPKRHRSTSLSSSCSSDDEQELHQQEVFPEHDWSWPGRAVGSLQPYKDQDGKWMQPIFGELKAPPSPLLRYIEDPEGELEQMLSGYDALERTLQYRFKDRSLLLQALTHASHHSNRLTDCYQRLEFLGDAILDYLITRHLYEDPRRHCPGALTDLRSALVNNTIFATLAARHGFHKYFRHMSPGLNEVLTKYVKIQEENGHSISEEHYLIQEDEMEQAEDVEVPKALGDLFESVAGAIFLDSGMSLGAVWKSYVNLMGAELEAFSAAAPKSPVRELLEAEPDTAKFGKPERLADGRRVRVCVEVFGRGTFRGVGRNYRIAKGTAARCALRHLRNLHSH